MKKVIFWGISLFIIFFVFPVRIEASSQQAYKDYLYQFDQYRTILNDFKIARSEYLKFNTLVAQTTALEKTKKMLESRDKLLRSYLLFLNEKLNESTGMTPSSKSLYQSLIQNEVTFLQQHTSLIGSIGSIPDADNVSKQLGSHYNILQSNIRQTIIALSVGDLARADTQYAQILVQISLLMQTYRTSYSPQQQSTIDRWLIQIQNKRSLYQQKIDTIMSENSLLKTSSLDELDALFVKMQKELDEAKQYLSEGSSYLGELMQAIRYRN